MNVLRCFMTLNYSMLMAVDNVGGEDPMICYLRLFAKSLSFKSLLMFLIKKSCWCRVAFDSTYKCRLVGLASFSVLHPFS